MCAPKPLVIAAMIAIASLAFCPSGHAAMYDPLEPRDPFNPIVPDIPELADPAFCAMFGHIWTEWKVITPATYAVVGAQGRDPVRGNGAAD